MGSQGRHRCRVGNFPEARPAPGGGGGFPKPCDGSARYVGARYVGAFPGRDLRCAEERTSGCLPRARVACARKTVIPRTDNINVYWTIIV